MRREARARIDRWLAAVDRASAIGFAPAAARDDLPARALADSTFWCDEILAPGRNPHDAPGALHGVHRATRSTPDLLRHDLAAGGIGIAVIEGKNFLLVQVDPAGGGILAIPPADRAAAVGRAAAAIFRAPPSFEAPAVLDEGARMSTDEDADPLTLPAWHRRVEAGVRGGRLWFLVYKRTAQRVGFAREEGWIERPRRGRRVT